MVRMATVLPIKPRASRADRAPAGGEDGDSAADQLVLLRDFSFLLKLQRAKGN